MGARRRDEALVTRSRLSALLLLFASFACGRDITACAMIFIMLAVFRGIGRIRVAMTLLAATFAVAAVASRGYLEGRYLDDVVGNSRTVVTTTFFIWSATVPCLVRRISAVVLGEYLLRAGAA